MSFQAPKGTFDWLPPRSEQALAVREALVAPVRRAGYGYIETPVFEDTAAVRPRRRRVDRHRLQGDVHLPRQGRPFADPAARGHRVAWCAPCSSTACTTDSSR